MVFEYTSDFSHIADWDPGITASEKVTDGPVGLGSEFELEVRFGMRTVPMTYRITEYEPDRRVVLIGRGEPLEAIDEILLVLDGTVEVTRDGRVLNQLGPGEHVGEMALMSDIRRSAETDAIEDTLNYKAVAKRLIAFVGDSEYQLVETLAEKIAEIVLNEFDVPWLKLTVHKPGAVRGSRDVGVIIERGEQA